MARLPGVSSAAAAPCTVRAATSSPTLGATAQASESTPKAPTPIPLERDELSEDQLMALLAKKLDQLG